MTRSVESHRKFQSKIAEVPLVKMRVSTSAQRDLRPSRVDHLLKEFDLDDFGLVVVNQRDSHFWIIDGQHRIEALKQWLGDWEGQVVNCRVYSGMTEQQEAEMFDRLNNQLTVQNFDKFKVRVTAGRQTEVAVKKVVEKAGLKVARSGDNAIGAVATLVKVYDRAGADTLSRALKIAHASFGDPGMSASVIDGMGHLCERYNGSLNDGKAIERLGQLRGGIGALISRADLLKKQTRQPMPQCIAAAVVDILNSSRGGTKLPSWWSV